MSSVISKLDTLKIQSKEFPAFSLLLLGKHDKLHTRMNALRPTPTHWLFQWASEEAILLS